MAPPRRKRAPSPADIQAGSAVIVVMLVVVVIIVMVVVMLAALVLLVVQPRASGGAEADRREDQQGKDRTDCSAHAERLATRARLCHETHPAETE
jgi:flagellar basal body-associated protein FliL